MAYALWEKTYESMSKFVVPRSSRLVPCMFVKNLYLMENINLNCFNILITMIGILKIDVCLSNLHKMLFSIHE